MIAENAAGVAALLLVCVGLLACRGAVENERLEVLIWTARYHDE